jgi:CubicO group peptidase (beta-lactamase class C family)
VEARLIDVRRLRWPQFLKTAVLATICSAVFACKAGTGVEQPARPQLDNFITDEMARSHIPGLAAAIVRHGETTWIGTYGFADLEAGRPVTKDTLFMLGSVSKSFTATAVMQLVERGQIDLDGDVNRYLPFEVRNPHAPTVAITVRQLLAHTSSIADNDQLIFTDYSDGDSNIPLASFVRDYLVPEGAHYDATRNFLTGGPGQVRTYSNIGYALLGFIVERVGGTHFDVFTRTTIFAPLGMTETSWFLRDLDETHIARPYTWVHERYEPHRHYGYPDYPDGQLRTSVVQLARYLAAQTGGPSYRGQRILAPESLAEMRTPASPEIRSSDGKPFVFGLGWYEENHVWGHGGRDLGVTTEMFYRGEDGVGVIVLCNASDAREREVKVVEEAIARIKERLFHEPA